mmetsp:Transcript_3263/g.9848  ORF Transcript_3263/g.9848 Transcript_3263/m.9848 type:complete len:96 (+) Transcript_3263:1087-1374(+)
MPTIAVGIDDFRSARTGEPGSGARPSSEALDLSEERVCVETAFSDSALPLLPPATNPPVAESPPPPLLLPPPPLLLPPPLLPHPHPSLTMDARDS